MFKPGRQAKQSQEHQMFGIMKHLTHWWYIHLVLKAEATWEEGVWCPTPAQCISPTHALGYRNPNSKVHRRGGAPMFALDPSCSESRI